MQQNELLSGHNTYWECPIKRASEDRSGVEPSTGAARPDREEPRRHARNQSLERPPVPSRLDREDPSLHCMEASNGDRVHIKALRYISPERSRDYVDPISNGIVEASQDIGMLTVSFAVADLVHGDPRRWDSTSCSSTP